MAFSITNTPDKLVLKLEGAVTIKQAQALATRLGETLIDGAAVEVDTSGLEDIDTCILQLLYSLRKTATAISFDDSSEVFLAAVDRCGLRRELLNVREVV
jgi:anti-anti-sigma regulatory factor